MRRGTNTTLFILLAASVLLGGAKQYFPGFFPGEAGSSRAAQEVRQGEGNALRTAWERRRSNVQVGGTGTVSRILRDDTKGTRHQKFILMMPWGQSVLIAHNIDLSSRLQGLAKGDRVGFFGEYEWNDKGGVVHWTHRDPRRRHPDGWLRYKGVLYQ